MISIGLKVLAHLGNLYFGGTIVAVTTVGEGAYEYTIKLPCNMHIQTRTVDHVYSKFSIAI